MSFRKVFSVEGINIDDYAETASIRGVIAGNVFPGGQTTRFLIFVEFVHRADEIRGEMGDIPIDDMNKPIIVARLSDLLNYLYKNFAIKEDRDKLHEKIIDEIWRVAYS